jgi:hypothetical protein
MSTTTTSSRTSYVQWLIESRPRCLTWFSWPTSSSPTSCDGWTVNDFGWTSVPSDGFVRNTTGP